MVFLLQNWRSTIVVLLWCTTICSGHCNPAPIGSPGTSLLPLSLKKVRGISIASEELVIKDGAKAFLPPFTPKGNSIEVPAVEYEAAYRFQNRTGLTVTTRVGFPVITYMHTAGDSYGGFAALSVTFGGKKVAVTQLSKSSDTIFPKSDLSGVADDLVAAALAKNVPAAPEFVDLCGVGRNKTHFARILRASKKKLSQEKIDSILKALDKSVFGDGDEVVRGQRLVWYAFDLPIPGGLSPTLKVLYTSTMSLDEDYSINYLLRTAKYWDGAIGKLRIVLRPDSSFLKKGGRYELFPKNAFEPRKGEFVHHSKMRIPDFDIQIKRISGSEKS